MSTITTNKTITVNRTLGKLYPKNLVNEHLQQMNKPRRRSSTEAIHQRFWIPRTSVQLHKLLSDELLD